MWRGAGLALPVFAARTHNSVGCGEFLDLLPLVEFADAAGMRLLQVRDVGLTGAGALHKGFKGFAREKGRSIG